MTKDNVTRGYGLLERFLAKKRAKMANEIIPLALRTGRILDIGCGPFPYFLLNTVSASGAMIGNVKLRLTSNDLERYKKLLEIGLVRADTIMNFSGKSGCPAGKERIHITAFGDVITCPHVQVSYGNIREQSLKKIWQEMYSIPDLHKYSSVCKHAFDQEYYDKFLKPIEHIIQVPISVYDHPKSNEILRNR